MGCTDCLICGGPRFLDERDMPSCEACKPMLALHVVSMQTAPGQWVAICPCGWSTRHSRTVEGRDDREVAVLGHWRSLRVAS